MIDELLFYKGDIFSVLRNHTEVVKKRVQSLPANELLNASEYDLIRRVVDEFRLNVPVVNEEDLYIAQSGETQLDVSQDRMRMIFDRSEPFYVAANKTVIAIPFAGDGAFFDIRPQTYSSNPPRGKVQKGEILLTYVRTDHDGAAIKSEYQRTLAAIQDALGSLSASAEQFNGQLEALVTGEVQKRKQRLLADAGMTAAIGLPVKRRHDTPTTFAVPVTRRAPRIEQSKVYGPFKPEPTLAREDYDEMLRIMKSMVQVMELSPHAFRDMGEEDLRTHFLVQLNGAYSGQATGETFNFQGKTDILVRAEGKNVFIAECKFWKGEKVFLATLDQMLSYLSWRDTKAAVLMFNRNNDFSAVLAKIAEIVPKHPSFKRDLGKADETTFRYVFSQPNDSSREISVTVLAFDVPTAPVTAKAIGAGRSFESPGTAPFA